MTYIKKLVMQGFKSFPRKTEVPFDKGINVIVGPNGSGKSNISDALCFVLGRLSIKSMRAAKAKNLLFMGSKVIKPSKEASVEIIFDNENKTFSLPHQEVSLKRIVRNNGQSIYKINDETKTRTEVIETLAQAGIDPHGFNLILQGQIQSIVRMHPEERRKIIEEVAGISIYEFRKEKSLKELEKTESRLKEISAVLRERTAYLRNLENERAQALRYKELEQTVKRCKASVLNKRLEDKQKELASIRKSIEMKSSLRDKSKKKIEEIQNSIESFNEQIKKINKHIQQSTGVEQDTLHEEISNLKAELEGLRVRKENYQNRKSEIENRIEQLSASIPEAEAEIKELRKKSPLVAKKQEELKKRKTELSVLEEEKRKLYSLKAELNSLKERLNEKTVSANKLSVESDSLLKQIEESSKELIFTDKEDCLSNLKKLKTSLSKLKESFSSLEEKSLEQTKKLSIAESQIEHSEKTKGNILDLEVCPLCQNQMTEDHRNHVTSDCDKKIKAANQEISLAKKELETISKNKKKNLDDISSLEKQISTAERELSLHDIIKEKQSYMSRLISQEKELNAEIKVLQEKRSSLEGKTFDISGIEEKCNSKIREIEEISSRTEEDLDTTLLYKERDIEKTREIIKSSQRDSEELSEDIEEILGSIETKSETLEKKEEDEQKLNEKFKQMFKDRDLLQEKISKESYNLSSFQNELYQIDEQVNHLKIGNAKIDAEREALEMELKEFSGVELIKLSLQALEEKLIKSQDTLSKIGMINLRALEVYEGIKEEYDKVKEKADTLEKEKEQILNIIQEIDNKKKRTFMKTFRGLNSLFNTNFARLSTKGQANLELQNKEDIFSGGIDISIKLGKGKNFDVTSLSGGEQTLVALSLLFAIQEFKPYHFYVFDEIDAALDKRNSERLSSLLRKYMEKGQYIVVTHNDAVITDSNVLYGVSMHEGASKILTLKI